VLTSMRNRHIRGVLVLAVLGALSAMADDTRADDYVARSRQFLRQLYPSLDQRLRPVFIGRRLHDPGFRSSDTMNLLTVLLYDFELGYAGEPLEDLWCSRPAVKAIFGFDWQTANKELFRLEISGPAIDGAAMEFAQNAGKLRGWSQAEVAAALSAAGARYGPDRKAEFLRSFPRERLKPFIGGDLEVVSAGFYFEHSAQIQLPPTWVVEAKWHAKDGRESDCTLSFEPFNGNLTMISLTPVAPNSGDQQDDKRKPKVP